MWPTREREAARISQERAEAHETIIRDMRADAAQRLRKLSPSNGGVPRLPVTSTFAHDAARSDRLFIETYVAVALMLAVNVSEAQSPQTTVLKAARMITIASPSVIHDAAIVVTGNKIIAAGPSSSIATPAGSRVIELGDVTLLDMGDGGDVSM